MSFEPKTQAFNSSISSVTIGTGDKAVTLGGINVLPFYAFDAPITNAPKIGVEITDHGMAAYPQAGLQEFYVFVDILVVGIRGIQRFAFVVDQHIERLCIGSELRPLQVAPFVAYGTQRAFCTVFHNLDRFRQFGLFVSYRVIST